MGIHKVSQRNLSVAFRLRSHFLYCFEPGSYWRLHFCNVPATEPPRHYRACSFHLLSLMRNRFEHRLAVDAIGSPQVIEALPDTPRAALMRLPVPFARETLRQSAGPRLLPSFLADLESRHDFRKSPALAYRSMKCSSRVKDYLALVISLTISCAAARGSVAAMIGRPTTM